MSTRKTGEAQARTRVFGKQRVKLIVRNSPSCMPKTGK
jgi:hypothetical protein